MSTGVVAQYLAFFKPWEKKSEAQLEAYSNISGMCWPLYYENKQKAFTIIIELSAAANYITTVLNAIEIK